MPKVIGIEANMWHLHVTYLVEDDSPLRDFATVSVRNALFIFIHNTLHSIKDEKEKKKTLIDQTYI